MTQLEKKLRNLQKDGYQEVTIVQVLNWMSEIKRANSANKIERNKKRI